MRPYMLRRAVVAFAVLVLLAAVPLQAPERPDVLLTVDSTALPDIKFALDVQGDSEPTIATHELRHACIPVLTDSAVIRLVGVYSSSQWAQPGKFIMFWTPGPGHYHLHINVGAQGHIGFEPQACQ